MIQRIRNLTGAQLSAIQGVLLALVAVLATTGAIAGGLGHAIEGVVVALVTLIAAFGVRRPRDHVAGVRRTK